MTTASSRQFDRLAAVDELHAAVRKWTEHIPQNLPYVDLMFAFGFATLGDRPRAESLVEAARKVMQVPIPPSWETHSEGLTVVGLAMRDFLFKAFEYRVGQALIGNPHAGPLSPELLAELEAIAERGRSGTYHPYKLVSHVIDKFRDQSFIVEPHERPDPYALWIEGTDPLKAAVVSLHEIHDPSELADRIRTLLRDGIADKPPWEVQLCVLNEALPLAPRVGEAFTVELLELVPFALRELLSLIPAHRTDFGRIPGELLQRGLLLAGHYSQTVMLQQLLNSFVELVRSSPTDVRFRLVNAVAGVGARSLMKLGMRDELDRFFTMLQAEVLDNATIAELRDCYSAKLDAWSSVLQTLLSLASGWFIFGLPEQAEPILKEVRHELLHTTFPRFDAKDYTPLARAYVATLGYGPAEPSLVRIIELFQRMNPKQITNTWTTAEYYSRFHLNLVEDTVLVMCGTHFAPPHVVSAGSP
jgi:cellulose synthase operon protein C